MDSLEAALAPFDAVIETAPSYTTWADIEAELGPISYTWDKWLPNGLLTILAGHPGEGKSSIALHLCGCITDGLKWPDGSVNQAERGAVLWLEAESAQAINLQRAKNWNLSISKFITPFRNGLVDVHFEQPAHREAVIEKAKLPEVRLIVMDSLSGSNNLQENQSEAKRVPEFLAKLARDTQKPILLTHHLRKRNQFDTGAVTLDRLRGSSAITQSARLVWALDRPDTENPQLRLSMIKNNLGRFAPPIGLEITETGLIFGEAPQEIKDESAIDRAADLLMSLLKSGPLPQSDIETEFNGAGISIATMKRAKEKLHIVSRREGSKWTWGLPARS